MSGAEKKPLVRHGTCSACHKRPKFCSCPADAPSTCPICGKPDAECPLMSGRIAEGEWCRPIAWGSAVPPAHGSDSEAWQEFYKPITNHLDPNASWQDDDGSGVMFETFGEEVEYVLQADRNHVWTYSDGDDGSTIVCAGYWLVNRIGYFVTELPWSDPDAWFVVSEAEPDDE